MLGITQVFVEILADGFTARTSVEGHPELGTETHMDYALTAVRLRAPFMTEPVKLSDQMQVTTTFPDGSVSRLYVPALMSPSGFDPEIAVNHVWYDVEYRRHLAAVPPSCFWARVG